MANKIKKKFIEDEIFSEISADIAAAVSAEEALRSAADAALQNQIDALDGDYATDAELAAVQAELDATQAGAGLAADGSYVPRVEGDVNYIDGLSSLAEEIEILDSQVGLHAGQIELEIEDRAAADADLQSNIDAVQADVDQNELDGDNDRALIRSEFAAADSTLQGNIDAEVARAIAAEADLQASIDFITSNTDPAAIDSLTEVVAAFQGADNDLNQAISDLSAAATTDRALIRSEFAAADDVLQSNIDAVQADVDQNEADADAAIAAATTDRALIRSEFAAADSTLQGNIDAVQADVDQNELDGDNDRALIRTEFAAADADLQTELDATQAGAGLAADGSYVPRVEGDVNYIDGSASLAEEIFWLDSAVGLNETAIEVEAEDRAAADADLQSNIDAVQADVDQNEADADAAIAAATADRALIRTEFADADTALQGNIDAEVARAIAAEADLQASIDFITSNTDPAAIDSLTEVVAAFQGADNDLNQAISDLSAAATTDRALIRSEFAAADSTLQGNIDAVQADVDQNELDGDNDRALIRTEFAAADTAATTDRALIRSEFATADALLQADIQELQAVAWFNETVIHDGDDTLPSLTHEPVSGSLVLFAGRVALHEGVDYTISGKDVTFIGSVVVGGAEGLVSGEKIYAKYQK